MALQGLRLDIGLCFSFLADVGKRIFWPTIGLIGPSKPYIGALGPPALYKRWGKAVAFACVDLSQTGFVLSGLC